MGKNSALNSIGRCIGNIALHKLLLKHTNIPESKKHLGDEIRDYGEDVLEKIEDFKWNEQEKLEIREKAIRRANNLLESYPDVKYEKNEIEDFVDEIINENF